MNFEASLPHQVLPKFLKRLNFSFSSCPKYRFVKLITFLYYLWVSLWQQPYSHCVSRVWPNASHKVGTQICIEWANEWMNDRKVCLFSEASHIISYHIIRHFPDLEMFLGQINEIYNFQSTFLVFLFLLTCLILWLHSFNTELFKFLKIICICS